MIYKAIGATIAAAIISMASVVAANSHSGKGEFDSAVRAAGFAQEYGRTAPPIGWVQFCQQFKRDCEGMARRRGKFSLDEQRWRELVQVNTYANQKIEPVTDEDNYGRPEYWTYPESRGDCEDYALLKRRYLMNMGWPREALLMTVVINPDKSGHAVLTAVTDRGEFILDNQSAYVLPQRQTPYIFVKRQSQIHPQIWVSLNQNFGKKVRNVAGRE